jgi:16S rRNA (guanine(966)-N(2))-methyltransferase RsmD
MRIISGRFKGRRLKTPTWGGLRPTSDRLRETLFNILAGRLDGAFVLDAYAGTGALGIEALSRGASQVVFVERDRRAVTLIGDNLRHCGIAEGCAIIRADIGRLSQPGGPRPFDVILLDPPYEGVDLEASVGRAAHWLSVAGVLVLEHARRRVSPPNAGDLTRTRVVRSGDSALSFYRRDSADASAAGDDRANS